MPTLLKHRTWRNLRLTAHAHGLPFHTKHNKAQVYARLYHSLIDEGALRRQFKRLSADERAALQALQAAGGTLPQRRFQKAFGAVRLYRPWRGDDVPKTPWKRPQSIAEKLWYLGFIEIVKGRPDHVSLPDEVLALLPPLPRLEAETPVMTPLTPSGADALCGDVALMLGALMFHDVCPLHGRWIPLRALRRVNRHLRTPEDLNGVRSELQTGRLRFLHYLAECAGLAGMQGGFLKPTVQAWRWLDLTPEQRWQTLYDAIIADLHTRQPLWQRYRLPPIDAPTWAAVSGLLQRSMRGSSGTLESFVSLMQPYLPEQPLTTVLPPLLAGPVHWLGIVSREGENFCVAAPAFSESQNVRLIAHQDKLEVLLPVNPHLRALVMCAAWAHGDHHRLCIDADSIRRALEKGSSLSQVASVLAELIGEPLPSGVFEQIQRWSQAAERLTLRHVILLTAQDADTLTSLRADWRLRPLMGEPLSPHHMLVQAGRAEALLTKLERRGHCVTGSMAQTSPLPNSDLSPHLAEYLWLAVRVYQKLGAFIAQDTAIPNVVREWLAHHMPENTPDSLEHESSLLIDRLARSIRGEPACPPMIQQADFVAIRAAIQSAYDQRGKLTIEYFSPAHGGKTVRTIEPIMIYQRNGAEYVEAWCHLDDASRTFRFDRIVRVIADDAKVDEHPMFPLEIQ